MISRRRIVRSPRFETAPSFCLPPVDFCSGVSPSQAAKSRPAGNPSAAGTSAVIAVEVIGPTLGIVINRRAVGSDFERWLISASKTATCASNAVKVSTSSFRMMRTLSGSGDWRSSTRADLSALSRRHLRRHCSPWPTRKTAGSTLSAQAVLVRPQSGHSIAAPEAAGYLGSRHQAFARGAVDPGTCVMGAKYRRWQNLQHRYGVGRYLWDAVHTRLSTLPAESFWSVEA